VFTQGHNAALGMRELPAPACRLPLRTATAQRWTHPGCESVLPARRPRTPHPGVPARRAWAWSLPKAACPGAGQPDGYRARRKGKRSLKRRPAPPSWRGVCPERRGRPGWRRGRARSLWVDRGFAGTRRYW